MHLLLILLEHGLVNLDLGGSKGRGGDEFLRESVIQFIHAYMQGIVPESGYRRVSGRAKGRASRSYNWTWPRCRSTEGFSCGGR